MTEIISLFAFLVVSSALLLWAAGTTSSSTVFRGIVDAFWAVVEWMKNKGGKKKNKIYYGWRIAAVVTTLAITLVADWALFVRDGEYALAALYAATIALLLYIATDIAEWAGGWVINIPLCVYLNTGYALVMGFVVCWRTTLAPAPVRLGVAALCAILFWRLVLWMEACRKETVNGEKFVKQEDGTYLAADGTRPEHPDDPFDGPYSVGQMYAGNMPVRVSGPEWLELTLSEKDKQRGVPRWVYIAGFQRSGKYFVAWPNYRRKPVRMSPREKTFKHEIFPQGDPDDKFRMIVTGVARFRVADIPWAIQVFTDGKGFTGMIQEDTGKVLQRVTRPAPAPVINDDPDLLTLALEWEFRVGKPPLKAKKREGEVEEPPRYRNYFELYRSTREEKDAKLDEVVAIKKEVHLRGGSVTNSDVVAEVIPHVAGQRSEHEDYLGIDIDQIFLTVTVIKNEEVAASFEAKGVAKREAAGTVERVRLLAESATRETGNVRSITREEHDSLLRTVLGQTTEQLYGLRGIGPDQIEGIVARLIGRGRPHGGRRGGRDA